MSPPPPPPFPNPNNPHAVEANGPYEGKPVPPPVIVLLNVVNALTQLLLGAVAFSAFSFANLFLIPNFVIPNSFTQHIYLCVTGYVILMSQAILSFNSHAGWAHSLKYPEKRMIHGILQILGSILAITGCIIRIVDRNVHFDSAHSITGMIAMMLTFLSLIGGILNFISPSKMSTTIFKTTHVCLGTLTLTIAFICLCTGFDGLYRLLLGNNNTNLVITFTVFALVGILISAFSNIIQRRIK